MPIVWPCALDVDAYAARGREVDAPRPACPVCGGPTQRWHGYRRHVRGDVDRLIWVPRVRCVTCGVTRALLPAFVLPHRWDAASHVGRAAEFAASGQGHRPIAALLGRPETTVRGWLRRFRSVATTQTSAILAWAVALGWSGLELPTAPLARLVAAVHALAGRWPAALVAGPWSIAVLVTGGSLLATNTTSPLAGMSRSGAMARPSPLEVSHGP